MLLGWAFLHNDNKAKENSDAKTKGNSGNKAKVIVAIKLR